MKLSYIFFLTLILKSFCERSSSDLKCIKANTWQNLISSTKVIASPTTCTKVADNCCWINMTYNYINFDVSSQYCFSLSGPIEEFKTYIENLYQDDLLYFANYTYRNKYDMRYLGRQLDYNYTENNTCWKAPSKQNYSTYLYNNCGQFKNGACLEEKDTNYFGNFTQSFYRYSSSDYCNKKSGDDKCIMYNGTRSNNAMVRPLLKDLIDYLHIDDPDYVFNSTDDVIEFNPDQEETIRERWPANFCVDIPKVSFDIVCPTKYKSGNYVQISLYIILLLISILVYE